MHKNYQKLAKAVVNALCICAVTKTVLAQADRNGPNEALFSSEASASCWN